MRFVGIQPRVDGCDVSLIHTELKKYNMSFWIFVNLDFASQPLIGACIHLILKLVELVNGDLQTLFRATPLMYCG